MQLSDCTGYCIVLSRDSSYRLTNLRGFRRAIRCTKYFMAAFVMLPEQLYLQWSIVAPLFDEVLLGTEFPLLGNETLRLCLNSKDITIMNVLFRFKHGWFLLAYEWFIRFNQLDLHHQVLGYPQRHQ